MLSEKLLNVKQNAAIERLYNNNHTVLIAATGAGKTIICLTAIKELITDGVILKVIVACPARVVPIWKKEAKKWDHTSSLKVVMLDGPASARSKSLLETADIVVISLNSLDWLLEQDHGCDGIIIDELSKASGKQAKGLRSKRKGGCFSWRVGMTATPVSQDFEKLYAMARIIDKGAALGTTKQGYLDKYFYSDYMGYNWTLREGGAEKIMGLVRSLVYAVEDTKKDDLPACHYHEIRFDMPENTRAIYNYMKTDMVAGDVEAVNEAVKSGKLRQLASGFIYDGFGEGTHFDPSRVDAANDMYAKDITKKLVIFYEFIAQYDELRLRFSDAWSTEDVEVFKTTNIPVLLAQINSLSHGIDGLQHVCSDILFYHPMWSRDATEQAVGRIWRTGQTEEVNVTTLICNDTLDDLVVARVEDRAEFMKLFMKHLKEK
tara:strand:+ start:6145 stop:7443 length:1299 start_codon:yes stop_codon:yes gene_type:complete